MRCRRCANWRCYRFQPIRLRLDGEETQAASVIVSKGRLYGGRFLLAPDACAAQPGFSVVLFDHAGIVAALLYGAALPLDLLGRAPGVRHVRARQIDFIGNEAIAGAGGRRRRRLDADQRDRRAGSDTGGGRVVTSRHYAPAMQQGPLRHRPGQGRTAACSSDCPVWSGRRRLTPSAARAPRRRHAAQSKVHHRPKFVMDAIA